LGLLGRCGLRQKQLAQGDHLKKRCKLWAPTWQKEVGWAPEALEHQRISCVAFPVLVERLGHRMSNESVLECVQRMKDEAIRKES